MQWVANGYPTVDWYRAAQGDFVQLASGAYHHCALTAAGVAQCWGSNVAGQLGDGTTTTRGAPVTVAGGLTFASLAAGGLESCGLTTEGAGYCWGANDAGELGSGETSMENAPVAVAGGLTFMELTVGNGHACGLTETGRAYCWGSNRVGQLGNGTAVSDGFLTPSAVPGDLDFVRLEAAADHTCGLTADGAAYCWGEGGSGQLGDGTTAARRAPTPVAVARAFVDLALGGSETRALTAAGEAYCWGWGWGISPAAATSDQPFVDLGFCSGPICGLTGEGAAYGLGDGREAVRVWP